MESYSKGLGEQPAELVNLDPETSNGALAYLLELACRAQNVRNIDLGRRALLSLPHDWLLARIEGVASSTLDLEDEWEYRRALELYWLIDEPLARRCAARGLASQNAEVREAARDLLDNRAMPGP
jgi:hypothetical protein